MHEVLRQSVGDVVASAAADGFAGVVAVDVAGEPAVRIAAGLANRATREPHAVTTRMRVASISKLLTSTAILRVAERGDLALDQPIAELVDGAAHLDRRVTVDRLLTMTSGIADWFDEAVDDIDAAWDALRAAHPLHLLRSGADYLPLFVDEPPLAPPGEGFRYSNASYVLLGLALEAVTGLTYAEAIRAEVTRPAGMTATAMVSIEDPVPGVAEGYLADGRRNVLYVTPVGAGDGGAVSDAADLLRLSRALRDPAVLGSEAVVASMTTPKVRMYDTQPRGYDWWFARGLQFLVDPIRNDVVRWGATGEEDGVSARLYHYPAGDVDVAILSNVSGGAFGLAWEVHDAVLAATAATRTD